MTTPTPTDFEDQLTRALRHRAAPVTADDGARVAIDRRIAQRTRARRTRRVGLAAVAVIVLLAGAFAVSQRGHDDASVVTGPGTPAVHLPQLGLPPELGTRPESSTTSPGPVGVEVGAARRSSRPRPARASRPAGAAPHRRQRPASSAWPRRAARVTDASIADIADEPRVRSGRSVGRPCDVGGAPAGRESSRGAEPGSAGVARLAGRSGGRGHARRWPLDRAGDRRSRAAIVDGRAGRAGRRQRGGQVARPRSVDRPGWA